MKKILIVCCSLALLASMTWKPAQAADLRGRILLQVESKGEAWYVYPVDGKRYFLGRPTDAFNVMRALGLGISAQTFKQWQSYGVPNAYRGRIVLNIGDAGKAYYINPLNNKLYYLGRPEDAFQVMRSLGLGIKNLDLATIQAAYNLPKPGVSTQTTTVTTNGTEFKWNYAGQPYSLHLNLNKATYEYYRNAQKYYLYKGSLPANWHEDYYAMFLKPKTGDNLIGELATGLKSIADSKKFSDDQLVELAVTFIQTIPYDFSKDISVDKPNYPYETVYLRLGVCSDKSLLLVSLLRKLGFGAALIDFDEVNHAAVGLACPTADGVFGTSYCYVETTNFLPIGVIPQSFGSSGIVDKKFDGYKGQFDNIFNTQVLGKASFYQKTSGKLYQGVAKTKARVAQLKSLEQAMARDLEKLKIARQELDAKNSEVSAMYQNLQSLKNQGSTEAYNNLVPTYNALLGTYKNMQTNYNMLVATHNNNVSMYNGMVSNFYSAS